MIEFLNGNITWWYWALFGLVLILAELLNGTLIFFGLGVVALFISLVDYIFPSLTINWELTIWGLLNILFFVFWKKILVDKRKNLKRKWGKSLNQTGIVIEEINGYGSGKVEFKSPFLDSKKWYAISDSVIPVGKEIEVVGIDGDTLKVKVKKDKEF